MRNPLFQAVGIVVRHGRKLLLLKRGRKKSYPQQWGLPGGKVEIGETTLQAAVRELFEETEILVSGDQIDLFATYLIVNNDMEYNYSAFFHIVDSVPLVKTNPLEHSQHIWATAEEFRRLPLVPKLAAILEEFEKALSPPGQLQLFELPALGPSPDVPKCEDEVNRSLEESSLIKPLGPVGMWHVAIGPPGAGKSTALKRMNETNPSFPLIQDNTILRLGTRLNIYLKDAFERGLIARFFHFQLEVLPLRWHQALLAPPNALVDESIFSTLAYSRALLRLEWITKEEYQTFFLHYRRYAALLSNPTTIFYFRCDVETLKRRIRRRGRLIEMLYERPYLNMLVDCFEEVALELAESMSVLRIDTTRMSPDEVVSRYAPKT